MPDAAMSTLFAYDTPQTIPSPTRCAWRPGAISSLVLRWHPPSPRPIWPPQHSQKPQRAPEECLDSHSDRRQRVRMRLLLCRPRAALSTRSKPGQNRPPNSGTMPYATDTVPRCSDRRPRRRSQRVFLRSMADPDLPSRRQIPGHLPGSTGNRGSPRRHWCESKRTTARRYRPFSSAYRPPSSQDSAKWQGPCDQRIPQCFCVTRSAGQLFT
jgi:hypothetical protein